MEKPTDDESSLNMKDIEIRFKILQVLESDPTPEEVAKIYNIVDEMYPYDPEDFDDAA